MKLEELDEMIAEIVLRGVEDRVCFESRPAARRYLAEQLIAVRGIGREAALLAIGTVAKPDERTRETLARCAR